MKSSTLRGLAALIVFAFVVVGLVFNVGTGTLSSLGYKYIAAICPLGALESLLGTKEFLPHILIALALMVLIVILIGKAFCSWFCPIPHLRRFFSTKKSRQKEESEQLVAADLALQRFKNSEEPRRSPLRLDSRHGILAATLLSALAFGFPVFCLVCPVGLTFASFIAIWNLVGHNDLTVGLLVFPLVLVLETVFFRKWCTKICPISALMSLISSLNKTFVPVVDKNRCQRLSKGDDCNICSSVCPEFADPNSNLGLRPMSECTKCNICSEKCPTKAIDFAFLKK